MVDGQAGARIDPPLWSVNLMYHPDSGGSRALRAPRALRALRAHTLRADWWLCTWRIVLPAFKCASGLVAAHPGPQDSNVLCNAQKDWNMHKRLEFAQQN